MKKKFKIILVVILLLISLLMGYFLKIKNGYHEDEIATFRLSNSDYNYDVSKIIRTEHYVWKDSQYFKDYLKAFDKNKFNISNVYNNQKIDGTHPPLYYMCINFISSLNNGNVNKLVGFIVNYIAIILTCILIYNIVSKYFKNEILAILTVMFYGFSIGAISTTIYFRMYAMLTFFTILSLNFHLYLNAKEWHINKKDCIALFTIVLFGFYTQYYFIVYLGVQSLISVVSMIKKKMKKETIMYIVSIMLAGIVSLMLWPYSLTQILFGTNGISKDININISVKSIIEFMIYKFTAFTDVLARALFANNSFIFIILIITFIGIFIYKVIKSKKGFKKYISEMDKKWEFLIIPTILYMLIVEIVSPYLSIRYIMNQLPIISILFVIMIWTIFDMILKNNKRVIIAISIVVILFISISHYVTKPNYLYLNYQ